MPLPSSITISVGSSYGLSQSFSISSVALELCPFLFHLTNYSSLPRTRVQPFRIVHQYLDHSDHFLSTHLNFTSTSPSTNTATLLLFIRTWALAARMRLPDLQDKLVLHMRDLYFSTRALHPRPQVLVDANIAKAFGHLEYHCGPNSHAERFLCSFVAAFAYDELLLPVQLRLHDIDGEIRDRVLQYAKSIEKERIVDDVGRFLVDCEMMLPRYREPEVERPQLLRRSVDRRAVGGGAPSSTFAHAQRHVVTATATATAMVGGGMQAASAQARLGISIAGNGTYVQPYYGDGEGPDAFVYDPPSRSRTRAYESSTRHGGGSNSPVDNMPNWNLPNPPLAPTGSGYSQFSSHRSGISEPRAGRTERGGDHRTRTRKNFDVETKYCGLFCLFNGKLFGGRRDSREREQDREQRRERQQRRER